MSQRLVCHHCSEMFKSKVDRLYHEKLHEPELTLREDGRLEWKCEHGIGHTVYEPDPKMRVGKWAYTHGCDGCCRSDEYKKIKKEYDKK